MSFWTPPSPLHFSGPTHLGRPFGEKYCVPRLASQASYPGNSGSVLMYRPSSQPSIPAIRSVTYLTKFGLPSSPSLTTSMPERACLSTHSATAVRTRSAKALGSGGFPASRARSMSLRSGGRGRLPVWVVRMRSVLRFNRPDLPQLLAPSRFVTIPSERDGCARAAAYGPTPRRLDSMDQVNGLDRQKRPRRSAGAHRPSLFSFGLACPHPFRLTDQPPDAFRRRG